MIKFNEDVNIEEKIKEVEIIMKKTKNIMMYKRYSVIRNHLLGLTNKKIAKIEMIAPHTVGIYINKYYDKRLDGLAMKYYNCGSESKLSPLQEKELLDVISNHTLNEVVFHNRYNWTISIVKEYIKNNYDIDFCMSATHVVIKRLVLSHTRPTYVLAKSHKDKQEDFLKDFNLLKEYLNDEVQHILFDDESMIRDYQAIQKICFIKEKQIKIPTYGKILNLN